MAKKVSKPQSAASEAGSNKPTASAGSQEPATNMPETVGNVAQGEAGLHGSHLATEGGNSTQIADTREAPQTALPEASNARPVADATVGASATAQLARAYPVLSPLRHDGRRYRIGEAVSLTPEQANPLLAIGIVGEE